MADDECESSGLEPQQEMPRYKCHKEVHAHKIANILKGGGDQEPDGHTLVPNEDGYEPIIVSLEYMEKHNPEVGGYYVVYKDGYASYSPAQPFEEGYSLME